MTLTFFFSMFCSLSGISLSWKTLVFGRFSLQKRTNVHRTAFFLHTPDFSLSGVTALKVVWGKDTSRRIKEQGSDLPSCFSTWAPFWKCGWGHHISRSGWGLDWPRFVRIKEHVASKCKQLFEKGTNVFFFYINILYSSLRYCISRTRNCLFTAYIILTTRLFIFSIRTVLVTITMFTFRNTPARILASEFTRWTSYFQQTL